MRFFLPLNSPPLILAFLLMIAQTKAAKFIFLQEKGQWLRLDNRFDIKGRGGEFLKLFYF